MSRFVVANMPRAAIPVRVMGIGVAVMSAARMIGVTGIASAIPVITSMIPLRNRGRGEAGADCRNQDQ
jgi:hypothetical protein